MGIQGCSGISPRLEVAKGLGVPGAFVTALPTTSTEELGGGRGWRPQLPLFHPSCQDVDIWKEKSGGGQIGVWSREGRRSLRKEGPGEGWVQKCVARVGRELLRGLTLSSWEVCPSPHTLQMFPPQTKLDLGQGPLEIWESWENVLWELLGKGPPRLPEGSAKLSW